jgi:hypothetical protein
MRSNEREIGELTRLELEAFGLLKIKRSRAGTESFLSFQTYFVGWHEFVFATPFGRRETRG